MGDELQKQEEEEEEHNQEVDVTTIDKVSLDTQTSHM